MRLFRSLLPTPLGDMLALSSEGALCALEFVSPRGRSDSTRICRLEARLKRYFPPHTIVDEDSPVLSRTRRWLHEYFEGSAADARALPLDLRGARFERQVWEALLRIPPGETRSYGAVARSLGAAAASRAVGRANGANPIAVVVPCHRVIGASGRLTGYGGGLDRKTWLLDHERRWRCDALL